MKSAVQRRVSCEPLEERRMFITYQVDGTGGADTISISIDGNSIISVVNGVSDSASDTISNNIEISEWHSVSWLIHHKKGRQKARTSCN